MPAQSIDDEIAKAKRILDNWRAFAPEIEQVRRLEMGTMITPRAELDQGYYRLPAVQGYQQILNAYQLLGNITPAQSDNLSQVSRVLENLQTDQRTIGDFPTPETIKRYSGIKMQELERTGEVYMLTGHDRHFNITKIKQAPDGGYTYTLYDAGHESVFVGYDANNRPLINAVQEFKVKPGTDLRALIETEVAKKESSAKGPEYAAAKKAIDDVLKKPPIRVEKDFAQRKGNCTTRGQRILAADILKDEKLSEGLYDFASNVQGTSTQDIKEALERRLQYLENVRDGVSAAPGTRGMDIFSFIKAADTKNYEVKMIPLDGGGHMNAFRTIPGLFTEPELQNLQGILARNGVDASVRESMRDTGKFYLYVPQENMDSLAAALQRDNSPAANLFRKYGTDAPLHLDEAKPKPGAGSPMAVLSDAAQWHAANTVNGDPITRLPLAGIAAADVLAIERILQKNGIATQRCPSASMGDTLRITGADVAKFEQLQKELPGGVRDSVLAAGTWKDAVMDGGAIITRTSVKDLSPEQVAGRMEQLRDAGFKPVMHESASMGTTIRLQGEDMLRVQDMRKEMIAQIDWQAGHTGRGIVLRVPTAGMTPDHVAALNNTLTGEGFMPTAHSSTTLGATIRLEGEDVGKMLKLQHKTGALHVPLADTPVEGNLPGDKSKFIVRDAESGTKSPVKPKAKTPVIG